MFVKLSLRERLVCLIDFLGMIILCLLPLPYCFCRVFFPTLFPAVVKGFLPLLTSPISGAANSTMSAPMPCATGTIYLCKNELQFYNILCKSSKPPSTLSSNRSIVWSFYLSESKHLIV